MIVIDRSILRVAGLFGTHSKEAERFIKFFIVGIMGAMVDFTTLFLLQRTILRPIQPHQSIKIAIATGISFCAAVMSNFIWNRYWTYPDSRSKNVFKQLAMFYGVNTAALAFRLVFVAVTFIFLAHLGEDILVKLQLSNGDMDAEALNKLGTNISQAIAVLIAMFWNFAINRIVTYNDVT
jgi:putative flippase GtrA